MLILLVFFFIIIIIYFLYIRKLHSSNFIIYGNKNIPADKLMIIAHPDDELIFGGKELLSESGWKVVCITNGTSKSENFFNFIKKNDRKKEFIKVMNLLKYSYEIWDHEDSLFNANWNEKILLNNLKRLLKEKNYKKIITHNLDGEYGHIQHKKISKLLHQLKPHKLYVFKYNHKKINPSLDKVDKLLKIYTKQNIIEKYYDWIIHQDYKLV